MVDRAGERFAEYRLVRRLGGGTFGDVYLGQHISDKTPVAIKILQARLVNSEDLKDFINEVRILFRLQHPNIVPLKDFGIENDVPFLVMDYASHGTLRQPKGHRLPTDVVVAYTNQIAAALQYAHDRKLIHRDVKPDNLLLSPANQVWLSDFGIASIAHSSRSLSTQEGAGTIAYMAPEQIMGKPRLASDQYALGIIVYEWLSGQRPFQGTSTEIAIQHTQAPPPSLRKKVSTISPAVEEVVMTTLSKEPQQRFASIQAFAEALEQASQPASSTSPAIPNETAAGLHERTFSPSPARSTLELVSHSPTEPATSQTDPPFPQQSAKQMNNTQLIGNTPLSPTLPASPTALPLLTPTVPIPSTSGKSKKAPLGQQKTTTMTPVTGSHSSHHTGLPSTASPKVVKLLPKHKHSIGYVSLMLLIVILLISGGSYIYSTVFSSSKYKQTTITVTTQNNGSTTVNEASTEAIAQMTTQAQASATALAHIKATELASLVASNPDPYPPYNQKLVLFDSLRNNQSGYQWQVISGSSSCGFIVGGYHLIAPLGFQNICSAQATDFRDFTYEVQMTFVKGDSSIAGGILFRGGAEGSGGYQFTVFGDGRLYVSAVGGYALGPTGQTSVQESTNALHIGLGQTNLIAVVAKGYSFSLYVNHQLVGGGPVIEYNTQYGNHGTIGVVAQGGIDSACEVVFQNARVWQ